jgi:hypothetical protein
LFTLCTKRRDFFTAIFDDLRTKEAARTEALARQRHALEQEEEQAATKTSEKEAVEENLTLSQGFLLGEEEENVGHKLTAAKDEEENHEKMLPEIVVGEEEETKRVK